MSETPTPRTKRAMHEAAKKDRAMRYLNDGWDFARGLERELAAARAELAAAHRRIHGEESEDCVFCASKKQTPGGDDPQCYLCTMEAGLAALRAEQATPLDRPDKPGWWWAWLPTDYCEGEGGRWTIGYYGPGDLPKRDNPEIKHWLTAAPPRDLREGGE